MSTDLRKRLIKMFDDIFKEDLTPADRLDIEPMKIQLVPHHKSITHYNARVPIDTPRYLESVARKELPRILNSEPVDEVPGSLVTNLKHQIVDKVGYTMNGSAHILRRFYPQDTCFAVVDLVEVFHQIPLAEDSRDLMSIVLPDG